MPHRLGFTLIEVLVVISVILILAALLVPVGALLRRKAAEVRTIQRMEEVQRELASVGMSKGNTAYVLQKRALLPGVLTYAVDDTSLDVAGQNVGEGALTYAKPHEFAYPWGKLYDSNGDRVIDSNDTPQSRNLAQLSALKTDELMQATGLLPADDPATGGVDEALEAYRSDRHPDQPFNDHWGNPLVVVYGIYQPPMDRLQKDYTTYGYNRSVYIAVGAGGSGIGSTVRPFDDPAAYWSEIASRSKAAEWTEASWNSPAWEGVRVEKDGSRRTFITAPIELK